MTKIKKILLVLLICLSLSGCKKDIDVSYFNYEDFNNVSWNAKSPWYEKYKVIAHALGGVDEYDYTNTYEALVANYNEGTRVFETDIGVTEDDQLILLHEWQQYHEIFSLGEKEGWESESYDTFKSNKIYGKYTPMSFDELLDIMTVIPDFYIVIDSKTFDKESAEVFYQRLVETIKQKDEKLLKRFIPQAYNEETYLAIKEAYEFDDIILTLYSMYYESDGDKVFQLAKKYKIKNIVCHMDNDWATRVIRDVKGYSSYDSWGKNNINIFIHTVNDEEIAKSIINDEKFNGIYSDFITENSFKTILNGD